MNGMYQKAVTSGMYPLALAANVLTSKFLVWMSNLASSDTAGTFQWHEPSTHCCGPSLGGRWDGLVSHPRFSSAIRQHERGLRLGRARADRGGRCRQADVLEGEDQLNGDGPAGRCPGDVCDLCALYNVDESVAAERIGSAERCGSKAGGRSMRASIYPRISGWAVRLMYHPYSMYYIPALVWMEITPGRSSRPPRSR